MASRDRLTTQEKTIEQLMEELTFLFIPIVARLCSLREAKLAAINHALGVVHQFEVSETALSDVPELDVLVYEPYCKSLVGCWFRLLEERYQTNGLICGMIDERLLPRNMTDEEIADRFSGLGFYLPDTTDTDVELVISTFRYFKQLHCLERDLPRQMIRLLEMNNVTLDVCL